MKVLTATVGSYPRPEWFRIYLKKLEGKQKDLSARVDPEVYRKAVLEVIEEQRRAGIDLMTDGQLIWHDFLASIASRIKGFAMNGLTRYFNNNLYYRRPVVKSRIEREKPILEEFGIAFEIERRIKAVLSCFTLAKLSKNEYYRSFEDFLHDLSSAIYEEAEELANAGVEYIQIDEPFLLYASREELELAKAVFEKFSTLKSELILMTYFRSAERVLPEILDLFDLVGLDFVEGFEENLKLVGEYGIDRISVGIIDGRNTRMENVEDLKRKLGKILETSQFKEVHLSPNTGLEFLPRVKAFEKMRLLSELKKVMNEVV